MSPAGPAESAQKLLRAVPPFQLSAVVVTRLENRRGESGANLQDAAADIREPVTAAGGHDDRLVGEHGHHLVLDAYLGLPLNDLEDFFDGVRVHRRAQARLAKLLEDAELMRSHNR